MAEAAWKSFQRRWCRAFGMESAWRGEPGSDGREAGRTLALEVKRTKGRTVRSAHVAQAIEQGRAEGLPWILVVGDHNDRAPVAVCDARWLATIIAREDGNADALVLLWPRDEEASA